MCGSVCGAEKTGVFGIWYIVLYSVFGIWYISIIIVELEDDISRMTVLGARLRGCIHLVHLSNIVITNAMQLVHTVVTDAMQ